MDSSNICFDLGLNHKLYATFIENEQSMNWKALREERMELTCRCNRPNPSPRCACMNRVGCFPNMYVLIDISASAKSPSSCLLERKLGRAPSDRHRPCSLPKRRAQKREHKQQKHGDESTHRATTVPAPPP